jgi:predicted MFS family arabinose efflux permease
MVRVRTLAATAGLTGTLCLAAGLSYLTVSPTELTISALVAFGAVGFAALLGAGIWQARVKAENRRLPLLVLGAFSFIFALGGALGVAGAQIAREARLEPTGLPIALHAVGVVAGLLLLVLVIAELLRTESRAFGTRHGRSHPA